MQTKPLVALVGKPNVGKSTFFNKVSGQRVSIVSDEPGVTRDRIYADAEWLNHSFTMIDTGGIQLKSDDNMMKHIRLQAEIAIDLACVILFFVDGKNGLTSEDYDVLQLLRKAKKPTILVVNKAERFSPEEIGEYYALGIGEPFLISAEQKLGIGDLLDEVVKYFPAETEETSEAKPLRIAVVGRPNAGKSSLVNKILGYDRTIVSNVAGTTRDAIDTPFTVDGKHYVIVDTAGMRRKRSIEDDSIEAYSVVRALNAIRTADVCLVVLDATEEISEQDVRIAGYVHEQGKPSVVVINKWDVIEKDTHTIEKFNADLARDLAFMDYFKSVTVSAKTGQRVGKLLELVQYVYEKSTIRISTGVLNDVIFDAIATVEPPSKNGKRLKIRYCTQPLTCPPTFVLFVNDETLMHFSYKRYLENCLRKAFSLDGTPIKLFIRNQSEEKSE